jgi:hypothetical protein
MDEFFVALRWKPSTTTRPPGLSEATIFGTRSRRET